MIPIFVAEFFLKIPHNDLGLKTMLSIYCVFSLETNWLFRRQNYLIKHAKESTHNRLVFKSFN